MKYIYTLLLSCISIITIQSQSNPYPLISIDSIQKVSNQKLSSGITFPDYVYPTFMDSIYGDTVQIEGVVSFDPHYYGLSKNRKSSFLQSPNSTAWKGIEVMIDTSIFNLGANNPTLKDLNNTTKFYDNFQAGLTVRCTGIITNFPANHASSGNTQLKLLAYETIITNTSTQAINPKVLTIDQFSKNNGAGGQDWQPETGEPYEGVYVEFQQVKVTDRSKGTGANSARWFWTLVDGFGNKIRIRDYSGYYRNDDNEDTYIANNYTPPATNTYLSYVRGVIIENISSNGVVEYMLAPLMPADVGPVSSYIPPSINTVTRNLNIPTSSQSVTITANITDDSAVSAATLYYAAGYGNKTYTAVNMTWQSGNIYTADIPAQANNTFVKYWIKAEDNFAHISYFPDTFGTNSDYIVLDAGITRIEQIQNTPNPSGFSVWAGDTLTLNIGAVVVSTSITDDLGLIFIQQGSAPFSGIQLGQRSGDGLNQLKRGDSIVITKAWIRESNGVTILDSLRGNYTKVSNGNPLPPFVNINIDSILNNSYLNTEAYEGMLVEFKNIVVNNQNPDNPSDFGEWSIYYDTLNTQKGLRVDDYCAELNNTGFNKDSLALFQKMTYIRGVFTFSFGNWKLFPRNREDIDLSNLPDKTAPVITLLGNWTDSLKLNGIYIDPGATALDNKDGDITNKIIMSGMVDSSKVGVYQHCFNVKDNAGNVATQVCRNIVVYNANSGIYMPHTGMFKLYPNPASEFLQTGIQQSNKYMLYSAEGKIIQQVISDFQGRIDITGLQRGLYFIVNLEGEAHIFNKID